MKKKFVVCLLGRFHAFEYISALAQAELLHTFVTSYPKKFLKSFVVVDRVNISGWPICEVINRFRKFFLAPIVINRSLCFVIGWRASLAVSDPTVGTYVQWLGTGSRWLRRADNMGRTTIVVCGNFHPRQQYRQLFQAKAYQLSLLGLTGVSGPTGMPEFPEKELNSIEQSCRELEICSFVQVVSTPSRDSFLREGFSSERIICVTTGVDFDYFRPGDLSRFPLSRRARVCFVGNGSFRKGFVEFCLLAEKCSEFDFYHVGSIEQEIQSLLVSAELLNKPNLHLKGRLSRFKVAEFFRYCDVLVLPSWEEGLAAVLLQALASGCLVLATRESGFYDLVPPDFVSDLGLESHDVTGMATRLRDILDDPSKFSYLRSGLLDHITEQHSWQAYQSRILDAYASRGII